MSTEQAGSCGLCGWRPEGLRRFATPRAFLIVYGLLGTTQAMAYIYFISTLTTLEKRFKISSKTTGIMLSGNEVSQILLSLVLTYYGGQRRRPLWIAWGVALSAASCFILALPHFIFGAGAAARALTNEYFLARIGNDTISREERAKVCTNYAPTSPNCWEDDIDLEYSSLPPVLVFLSQFVLGVGTTLYFTLGQTYLDDNTKKTSTPMLLGLTMALRTVGPAIGFVVGFLCLSLYIDPTLTPLINRNDPRWLGAWWLGWILLGTTMLIFALLMAMFPKYLPKHNSKNQTANKNKQQDFEQQQLEGKTGKEEQPLTNLKSFNVEPIPPAENGNAIHTKPPSFKEFPEALMRLLRNKILMCNIWSGVFYILGASVYLTFTTKYLEVQFQQSAAKAAMITGPVSIIAMMSGFLISGFVISKFRPRPIILLSWNVIVGIVCVAAELSFTSLGCPDTILYGYQRNSYGVVDLTMPCNYDCNCHNIKYEPVCYEPGRITFYSACHAGCANPFVQQNGIKSFSDCKCLDETRMQGSYNDQWGQRHNPYGETADHHHQYYRVTSDRQGWPPQSGQSWQRNDQQDWQNQQGWRTRNTRQTSGYRQTWSPYDPYNRQLREQSVTSGPCELDCTNSFIIFLIISIFMHTLATSGKIGNILVNYRSVLPQDKAFAQGLSLFLISLFAFIPGPILYGAIIDSTCLVWEESCGKRGNCWLYDNASFRFYVNITAAAITLVGVILDGVVCYLGRDLRLYDEEETAPSTPPTPPKNDSNSPQLQVSSSITV